jgi:hypothetical protein
MITSVESIIADNTLRFGVDNIFIEPVAIASTLSPEPDLSRNYSINSICAYSDL